MRNEFTAVIERDDDWLIGYCPEIPGANGQGKTVEECRRGARGGSGREAHPAAGRRAVRDGGGAVAARAHGAVPRARQLSGRVP